MKIDKAALKKHQFWLLLGLAVFLWAISLVLVMITPRIKAAKEAKDFEKAETDLKKNQDPKNKKFIEPWDERKKIYTERKNDVWDAAWQTQNDVMTWPGRLSEEMEKASFGGPIKPDSVQRFKNEEYRSQFESLDAFLATRGGEQSYFPVVFGREVIGQKTWKEDLAPSLEECWLAQEELWVRREIFKLITAALKSVGTFKEVRGEAVYQHGLTLAGGGTLDAIARQTPGVQKALYKARTTPEGMEKSMLFRNHSWEVELFLERDKSSGRMQVSGKSTIKNINPSNRSMLLVNGGRGLLLRIRQEKKQVDITRIEGQLLPPGSPAVPFDKPTPLAAGMDVAGSFQLEEVFDYATSPVKRLEVLEVGPPAQSHRLATAFDLIANAKISPPEDPQAGGGNTGAQGGAGGMGGNTGALGGAGGMGGATGALGGAGGMGGATGALGGGVGGNTGATGGQGGSAKSDKTPNDFARKRYTVSTDQVRCIPVGFVVVIDQAQLGELLTAVANSRLRIQTSQVHWRHREAGTLVASGGDGGGKGGPVATTPFTGGSKKPEGMGSGMPPMGSGMPPMGSGMPPTGGNPMTDDKSAAAAAASTLAEDSRNLIELSVYGVATLFERFKPPAPSGSGGEPGPTQPGPGK